LSLLDATGRAVRGVTLTGVTTSTWYVTFEIRKGGILPRQRSPRETRTFATEEGAKTFAREKFDQGLAVFAGTINPHTPKRLIASSGIHAWLTGEYEDAAPRDGENPHGENKE
jgi:hypothetical protein